MNIHDANNRAPEDNRLREGKSPSFQFSIFHLLLLCTANSLLFTIDHLFGTFLTSLLLGLSVIALIVLVLRFQNPFLGGFVGFFLAFLILFGAVALSAVLGEEPSMGFFAAILIYPMIGYTIGCTCATITMLRID